jgi:beta-glucosidase/6-phospho-beta-glucosidase/beta-galactosidase
LYEVLKELDEKYHLPLLITENGLPEKLDTLGGNGIRASFIVAHLQQLLRAIKDGINVIGYICWSLVDNFEWQEAYNEKSRFGLYAIDRTEDYKAKGVKSYTRTITKGATAFQDIIKKGTIDQEILDSFGSL